MFSDGPTLRIDARRPRRGAFRWLTPREFRFDLAYATCAVAETVDVLHRASGASTIHDWTLCNTTPRDVPRVATIHGAANYETAAEDYGRLLAGRPMFNPFG